MQPRMVQYVADLLELPLASEALEHLISSTSHGIYDTSLDVPILLDFFRDLLLLSCHALRQFFLTALSRRSFLKLGRLQHLRICCDLRLF